MTSKLRTVYFISDRTGITAETLGHALITQFEEYSFSQITLPYIDTPTKAEKFNAAVDLKVKEQHQKPIVFATIVNPKIRNIVAKSNSIFMDLFASFIPKLEETLHTQSSHIVGRSHGIADFANYNTRIDAVNFALSNDDGATLKYYDNADVILVGVSRSGKTPTCLYMALLFGIRAANYPITEEDLNVHALPKKLMQYKDKIVGLSIQPQRLQQIRSQRKPNSQYAALKQCQKEIQFAEKLFTQQKIPFVHSTEHSIEELATQIIMLKELTRKLR